MKFNKNLFFSGNKNLCSAAAVEHGDIIELSNHTFFFVEDIDSFFATDEIAEKYERILEEEQVKVKAEDSIFTFYDRNANEITDIPGTALLHIYRLVQNN